MTSIFLFAGEPSGDLHGSKLIAAIKDLLPHCSLSGVGGPEMRSQGLNALIPMEEFCVMGFKDVLFSLPKLVKNFYKVRDAILQDRPRAVVLIDYPGFNLRLAKALRKKGYTGKIVQYISPTVWAWGKGRVQQMSSTLDLLLTIYPFEAECFKDTSLKVDFVGHPLQEIVAGHAYRDLPFKDQDNLVAIFPGSRPSEIRRNLPKILLACEFIKEKEPKATFAISCASEKLHPLIFECLYKTKLPNNHVFLVSKVYNYELMRSCRSSIAKSGTVTLELALHQRPTTVVYEVNPLDRFIATYLIRLKMPFFCIVNILGNKRIFPELIESGFEPDNLAREFTQIHQNGIQRDNCIKACHEIQGLLQEKQASKKAAAAIVELLSC